MRIYKEEYKRYSTKTQERHCFVKKRKRLQRMIGDVHLISAYLGDFFGNTTKKWEKIAKIARIAKSNTSNKSNKMQINCGSAIDKR